VQWDNAKIKKEGMRISSTVRKHSGSKDKRMKDTRANEERN